MSKFLSAICLFLAALFLLFQSNGPVSIESLKEAARQTPFKQAFPEPQDPKTVTFNWNYRGRSYSLPFTMHGSIYEYYGREPKGVFIGKEESSLGKYLTPPAEDRSVEELTSKLTELAAANGLNENQRLELAVSFVQNIPYDREKAKSDRLDPRYPYEVLFENKGICSDKSFLMYVVLREMGYGGAVFEYPEQKHMNVGVESPRQYSTDNSGYAMIETTNPGFKIGVIPTIDISSGQALENQSLEEFNLRNPNTTAGKQLSSPEIYAQTTGTLYDGVIQTFQNQSEIADIRDYLERQQPLLEQKEAQIDSLGRQMDGYKNSNNIPAYNALVDPYNQQGRELKALIDEYNTKVARYNALIAEM